MTQTEALDMVELVCDRIIAEMQMCSDRLGTIDENGNYTFKNSMEQQKALDYAECESTVQAVRLILTCDILKDQLDEMADEMRKMGIEVES